MILLLILFDNQSQAPDHGHLATMSAGVLYLFSVIQTFFVVIIKNLNERFNFLAAAVKLSFRDL